MLSSSLSLFAVLAAGGPPAPVAPLPHSVAFVNDPRSHGQVGDGLLSLNEAIQLHNRTLSFTQLSLAEQLQISGFGQDVAWADLDASLTPVITMERDFDVIVDMAHGFLVSGFNGKVLIDFSGVTRGFVATSNSVNFRRLTLRGGPIGIHITQTDSSFGSFIDQVDFEGQTVAALRCDLSTAGDNGRLLVDACSFRNVPVGILVDEQPADRTTFVLVSNSHFAGVQEGMRFVLGPGGLATYQLERLFVDAAGSGVRWLRAGSGPGRTVVADALHLDLAAATGMQFTGDAVAPALLTWRMLHLTGTGGNGRGLVLGPLGSPIGGSIDEVVVTGDSEILTGGSSPLVVTNARLRGGSVTLGSTGTSLQVFDSVFDGTILTGQGTAPIDIRDSCFSGGTVQGGASAPVLVDSSYFGATAGQQVVPSNLLPAPQLGSMAVLPREPVLGGTLTLQADLPAGLFGVFVLGPTAAQPSIGPRPLHVYLDSAAALTLPGIYRLQQAVSFTVPNAPGLAGTDWVVQMGVFRDPGTVAPPLSLPPGRRFVLR